MPKKFEVSTDVRFTNHELKILTGKTVRPHHRHLKAGILYTPNPEDLKIIKRNRHYKVRKTTYDVKRRRTKYYLNARGTLGGIPFDSTQLTTKPLPSPGRPRQKRKYHFKRPYRHIKHRNRS